MNTNKLNFTIFMGIIVLPFIFNWAYGHGLFSSPLTIGVTLILFTLLLSVNFNKIMTIPDFLALFTLVVTLWMTSKTYKAYGCAFTCFNIFIHTLLVNNITFSRKQILAFHSVIVIFLGIFIFTLKIVPHYDSIYVYQLNGLMINPNTLGILMLSLYFHFLILTNMLFANKLKLLFFIIATPVVLYYIKLSQCRSAYISLVIFFLLWAFKGFNMKHYSKLLLIAVIVAIFFPFVYLKIADNLSGLSLGGKSLLSREAVWKSAIELIKEYPLLGSGTVFYMKSTNNMLTSSAHNVFLGLWKTIGFFPMIIFSLRLNKGRNMRNITGINIIKKKMFLSCIILCIFETLLNDSDTYIFFMTLLLTEKMTEEKDISSQNIPLDAPGIQNTLERG